MSARALGYAVLVEGEGELRALKFALAAAVRECRRNGKALSPFLGTLIEVVYAAMSEPGPADGHSDIPDAESEVELIDTATAAEILGVTPRHLRRLAPSLDGTRTRNGWVFHRGSVSDYRELRHRGSKEPRAA